MGGRGAVAGFEYYSTLQRQLPEFGDDAFAMPADLALEGLQTVVGLERRVTNQPHRRGTGRAWRLKGYFWRIESWLRRGHAPAIAIVGTVSVLKRPLSGLSWKWGSVPSFSN